MQDKVINKLIAADDLHWCPMDNKYTALSMDELNSILLFSMNNDITDEDSLYKIVKYHTLMKLVNPTLNQFKTRFLLGLGLVS